MAPTDAGTFLYDTDAHDLFYDADGAGPAAAQKLAHFDNAPVLTADDFDIVA